MNRSMSTGALCLLLIAVLAGPVFSGVPQTIVVDGSNDFDPSNLLEADGGDTETKDWCTGDPEVESPMDLGNIYLTNDTNFLYFGFDYDRDCFASPQVNLGIAIDVNTAAGGTTDAFGRKIAWNTVPLKPDFYVYSVLDNFNYEVLYQWTGSWTVVQDGTNGLGFVDDTGFQEGRLSLSSLGGLAPGDTINVEFWMTQDGTTKPPLDAACSDTVQTSTPSGTVFDVGANVEMYAMKQYIVQASADTTPPTVEAARAVGFQLAPNGEIETLTNLVDVHFSEPVGTAASIGANYTISGPANVVSASVDGSDASIVHLTLDNPIGPSATFFDVTVVNVQDQAGNPIVNNGTTNVGSFFLKKLRFEGDMSVFMLTNSAPPDTFAVEGNLSPLTFSLRDNALMQDPDTDSLYVTTVPLSVDKNAGTGKAEVLLEWKFSHHVAGYEPRPNRQHLVSSDNGDCDTLFAYWNDDLPSDVTDKAIDVCFQVDANLFSPGPGDTVAVTGDQSPLPNFGTPGIMLSDDGTGADQTAGDGIYAGYVRFPVGTFKTVNYKFLFNGVFECVGQGNRDVFLNDAAFDTVGGANGPLMLPARGIDRCTVTDKELTVHFRVDTDYWFGDPITSVEVGGNTLPLDFGLPTAMADDGVAPDASAADDTFSVAVVFPDSSNLTVEYKYVINGEFECAGFGNRVLELDDVNNTSGTPIVPPVGIWDFCTDIVTGIGDLPTPRLTLHLAQNYPNPFSPRTTIEFRVEDPGQARVDIFDVSGRKIRTLLDREVTEGLHVAHWNARDDRGLPVSPGIYFYRLTMGAEKTTRRMVLMP